MFADEDGFWTVLGFELWVTQLVRLLVDSVFTRDELSDWKLDEEDAVEDTTGLENTVLENRAVDDDTRDENTLDNVLPAVTDDDRDVRMMLEPREDVEEPATDDNIVLEMCPDETVRCIDDAVG